MADNKEAVIISAARTPTGKFQGALKPFTAPELGAIAIKEAVKRAGVDPAKIDEVIMAFIGIGAEKGTSQNLEASLLAELKKIQDGGVTAKELEKAKNQVVSEAIRDRETNDGKAISIEQAVAYQGDPKAVNNDIAALEAVTVADIQRVMKQYFRDNNRVVIYYNQEKKAEGTK